MVNDVVYRSDVLKINTLGKTATQISRDINAIPAAAVCEIADLLEALTKIQALEEEVEELFQENMAHINMWGDALEERDMWKARAIELNQGPGPIESLQDYMKRKNDAGA